MKGKILLFFFLLVLMLSITGCTGGQQQSEYGTDYDTNYDEEVENSKDSTPTLGDKMKDPEREKELQANKGLTVGSTGDLNGIKFKLDKVELSEGESYSKLDPGYIFMVFTMTITNDTDTELKTTDLSYSLDADGQNCRNSYVGSDNIYSINGIAPHTTNTISFSFTVPQSSSKFDLNMNLYSNSTNEGLIYSFTTNEVTH